jgi:hypothetical protein
MPEDPKVTNPPPLLRRPIKTLDADRQPLIPNRSL